MKKQLLYLTLLALSFLACTKEDNSSGGPSNSSDVSSTVFYLDTFRIYSTDLKGNNRKLVVDEGLNSQNNYIGEFSILPTSQQLIYTYTQIFTQPMQIKICKMDGTDKKVVKTLASSQSSIGFVKGTKDGNIIYQVNTFQGPTINTKTYIMKADGTEEKELQSFLYAAYIGEGQVSNQGKGVLGDDGYFFKINNGIFVEAESFNIFLNEDKAKIKNKIISADATKAAFVQSTNTLGKYEIRIKDNSKTAPISTVLYTLNIPADADQYNANIYFVNGAKEIIVSYGKFTSPRGSVNDYTNCDLIDVATGKVTQTWKFTGDNISTIITN